MLEVVRCDKVQDGRDSYRMSGRCMNCGLEFRCEFPMGERKHSLPCPRCGVAETMFW